MHGDDSPLGSSGRPFRMAALAVPADKDHLALARLTAMHVAGILGLAVSRLTDLRLAVNEACALLLRSGAAGAHDPAGLAAHAIPAPVFGSTSASAVGDMLRLRFERSAGELRVLVSGPAPRHGEDPDEVGWNLLRALVGDVRMDTFDGTATVTLTEPLPGAR